MSETLAGVNINCVGCKTFQFCVRSIGRALDELEPDATRLEGLAAEAAVGRPVDPAYLQLLSEVVTAGSVAISLDQRHAVQKTQLCPGQSTGGDCGLSPVDQLDMVPYNGVDVLDPEYIAIRDAAGGVH